MALDTGPCTSLVNEYLGHKSLIRVLPPCGCQSCSGVELKSNNTMCLLSATIVAKGSPDPFVVGRTRLVSCRMSVHTLTYSIANSSHELEVAPKIIS